MENVIKTLYSEKGELYAIINGDRILIAHCRPTVKIYERSTIVPMLGARSYPVKDYHYAVVLCPEPETTREVDNAYLRTVSLFQMVAEFQRGDGVFERVMFDNLQPQEIDPQGDWVFEVCGSVEQVRKLRGF